MLMIIFYSFRKRGIVLYIYQIHFAHIMRLVILMNIQLNLLHGYYTHKVYLEGIVF